MPKPAAVTPDRRLLPRFEAWLDAHPMWVCLLAYAVALGLRILHLRDFAGTLLATVPLMDEAFYRAEAWNIVRGAPSASDAYFMTPLYPWFLSLVFRLWGDGPVAPHAVQLALGALAAPGAYAIARLCMRPALALLPAAACASFAPLVFFEALFLVEGLVLLALLGALLAAVSRPASRLGAAACGVCLGIAALGRGSNLALAVPLAIWFTRRRGTSRRATLWRAAAFGLGVLAILSPLLVRNALRTGRPLLLTANVGFNLYVGNGPEANGIFVLLPGLDLAQDPLTLRYVQRQLHRPVTATEASDFWLERTRNWVREHPGHTLELFAWKLILFWNRMSIPQVEGFESFAPGTALGAPPFWGSFAFLPFGLLGLVLALWGWRRTSFHDAPQVEARILVALCTLVYSASIAIFFVTDRYRVPILPWLFVLASLTLASLWNALRAPRRARFAGLAAAVVFAFLATSPDALRIDRPRMRRDLHVHTALRHAKAGDFETALSHYRAALQIDPNDAALRDGLARMLSRAGQDSLAILEFRALLRDAPETASAWYNLGNLYKRNRRRIEALEAYKRALDLEPGREAAWNNVGEVFRAAGDTARAAEAYRRALAIVPAYARALNNLAALRASSGDGAAAEAGWRAALEADPRYLPAIKNLAILLGDTGRAAEAHEMWLRVANLDPADAMAARQLGRVPRPRTPSASTALEGDDD